jgi:signal transduction histidine kinase
LHQIIQNIVLNAAEAIRESRRESGAVRVSAREVSGREGGEDCLELIFADNGVGIDPENLARLFERGFTTKSHMSNSGFGLHWCANVLNALGGAIEASSDGIGRGACLRMRVPSQASTDVTAQQAA